MRAFALLATLALVGSVTAAPTRNVRDAPTIDLGVIADAKVNLNGLVAQLDDLITGLGLPVSLPSLGVRDDASLSVGAHASINADIVTQANADLQELLGKLSDLGFPIPDVASLGLKRQLGGVTNVIAPLLNTLESLLASLLGVASGIASTATSALPVKRDVADLSGLTSILNGIVTSATTLLGGLGGTGGAGGLGEVVSDVVDIVNTLLNTLEGVVPSGVLPSITLPTIAVPSIAVPSIAVPSLAIPSLAVPSLAIPSVALPSLAVPSLAIPSLAV